MTTRNEQGSTLSAQRAFVVHLSAPDGAGRRRFRGRVEHLSSGQSTHFCSLEALLTFFTAALDAADGMRTPLPRPSHGSGSLLRPPRRRSAQ